VAVERLQKILSNAGVASRRVAEEMIAAGRVAVNGTVEATPGVRADPDVDEVTVDGVPVLRGRYRYFLLNKPIGFITTAHDEQGRETVLDLVPIGDVKLHPIGRLDRESEGLLIITNDGHLTDLLTHPKYEVEKEYLVAIDAPLAARDLQRMVRGVEADGERLRAASVKVTVAPSSTTRGDLPEAGAWLLIVLRQGRNREIRRMIQVLGRKALFIRRIRVGPVHLGGLGPGAFRELTGQEVEDLYGAGKRAAQTAESPDPL
jgi:23S rRNA pseudouridine2605 synthase